MERRRLGRHALEVGAVGFGCWGIGGHMWIGAREDESLRALHRAVDLGCDLFDTALVYGDGHSERLLGRLLRERREPLRVATKVPPKNWQWPARRGVPVGECFPGAHVTTCVERSLANLGCERIDLLQLHVWRDEWLDEGDWRAAIERLKQAGKLRLFGVSINDHEPDSALRAVQAGAVDAVQVIYNIFDPTPAERLLPACQASGVGVLARVPLDEGGLTGQLTPETRFPAGDFRERYFRGSRLREVWQRAQALARLLGPEAASLPELALRFCLSHPAVTAVIPGMRRVETVEANVAVGDGRALSAGLLQELARHAWPRNFYS